MSDSTMSDRPICATCAFWQATREFRPFSIAWSDSSARCGNRRSPGFASSRSPRSGCGAWVGLRPTGSR